MQEIVGDLFASVKADAICITTNGWTKKDGSCVMGRGCADEAKKRWPGIEFSLGSALARGNTPHLLTYATEKSGGREVVLPVPDTYHVVPYHVVSFPVKPIDCGYNELLPRFQSQHAVSGPSVRHPGWMSQAQYPIIQRSAELLVQLAEDFEWKSVIIPRPGCGAGGLNWKNVKELLNPILDDRFWIITFR